MTDRRDLARDHEPRTLVTRAGREPRPSLAEERQITADVRDRERAARDAALRRMLGHLAMAEREIRAARDELPNVDRLTRRDLDRIRQAIARIRGRGAHGVRG